jgi:hypothetical protein
MIISDFDDVSYSLTSQPPDTQESSVVTVSIAMAGIAQFKQCAPMHRQIVTEPRVADEAHSVSLFFQPRVLLPRPCSFFFSGTL